MNLIENAKKRAEKNDKSKINSASANTIVQFTDIKAKSIAGQRTLRDLMVRIK